MTDIEPEEDLPPVAHVTMVYNGPVAPHWEMRPRYGEQRVVDDFWTRVNARLLLLPKHDPQFRRNRERVNRDAERERITCDWDLGDDDPETLKTVPAPAPGAPGSETAPEPATETAPEVATETAPEVASEVADDESEAAAEVVEVEASTEQVDEPATPTEQEPQLDAGDDEN